ncbi:signal peptidase II [Rhodovulum sp. BSW8]|uniref:Lipoprotein signal peptidase n=1 Tax=Rhodovulum visakhapatnamense TaxID=364297 RepID=A0ABS1REY5_9RHOB|nr:MULTISPECIES: signal peptidase II [Rhodovulum]MBL3569560.1 signal peptidase II [Rhodovulum visakhapatnamense]MBL3578214.1 signal peptidase II [Rhodovulum visakhapatnamense]OLS42908.1 signal peptidase II [Rhodovulum sulfidophilum]RBO53723.1 signal peptidase II [Rhodovulum sp. BSW8]
MRRLGLVAALVFLLDQASKVYVVFHMGLALDQRIDVWPPYLTFRMAWNRGVNFGLFAHDADLARWLLIGVSLAISAGVAIWMARGRHRPAALVSAGLLIGGALGNALDRVLYGAVADFLNMSCCGIDNPYAFNVADVAIFAGALGLVLYTGKDKTP